MFFLKIYRSQTDYIEYIPEQDVSLVVIGNDCIGGCKSDSHTITNTTTPDDNLVKKLHEKKKNQ